MNGNIFVRVLLAVLIVVLLVLLIPRVFLLIGFPLSSTLLEVITLCLAGWAALYIFSGQYGPL